jgi:LacI family transcriptional regulator
MFPAERNNIAMAKLQHIALLMGQDLGFYRDVIRGIRTYALRKPNWAIRNGPPDARIISSLREWNPDGIIAELYHLEFAQSLLRLRKPLVDTAFWLPRLKVSVVDVDHAAVGRMAAEYYLSLGLKHFAFFGNIAVAYSQIRQKSFSQRLKEAGHPITVCHEEYLREAPTTISWKKMEVKTLRWLQKLPKPVGLFVSNDILARSLADLCGQLGIHIPDEVALLGVDNDELECLLTSPPLSSIAIPGERIGYEAAKLLDQAMSEKKAAVKRIFLPPIRVVARQSTDTLAIRDPEVIAALRFIHSHAGERTNVMDVVRATNVGRRELERKFRAILGRSVLQELRRGRIQQAQKLLASTDLSMPAVARLSGFSSAHRLTIVFHRACGMTPTAYRRQSQIHDP